jgi:hypothetical protein
MTQWTKLKKKGLHAKRPNFNKVSITATYFSKSPQISKTSVQLQPGCSMRTDIETDRQTDIYDEVNSKVFETLRTRLKNTFLVINQLNAQNLVL